MVLDINRTAIYHYDMPEMNELQSIPLIRETPDDNGHAIAELIETLDMIKRLDGRCTLAQVSIWEHDYKGAVYVLKLWASANNLKVCESTSTHGDLVARTLTVDIGVVTVHAHEWIS